FKSNMPSTVADIVRSDLDASQACNASITCLQYVASYNWMNSKLPTIAVPGSPPRWAPPTVPPRMTPDTGTVYVDQNAARCPDHPLEPLFRAIRAHKPSFELSDVDVVSDRNNIRKLLRFVQASSSEGFEIKAEMTGKKTLLFTRVEEQPTETIRTFKGFGHNFERTYTKGLAGSTGHHRIVSYRFGGMNFLLRHETDGYVADGMDPSTAAKEAGIDDLSDLLGSMSVSKARDPANSRITVVTEGNQPTDVELTLEIKTRAASRKLATEDVLPQLWLSQTPLLVVAYHHQNYFHDVKVRDMRQEVRDWEATNRTILRKLAYLISLIRQVVEKSDSRRAVVRYDGGPAVQLISDVQSRALPEDLYSLWDNWEQNQDGVTCNRSEPPDIEPTVPSSMFNTRQSDRKSGHTGRRRL
ncbi:unnamed protein product, partial [Colletotrichum noveboracense]